MSDNKDDPAGGGRSRLDDAPVARRDFLGLAATSTAGTAVVLSTYGILRLTKAALLPTPSKRFEVNLPASMKPGQAFVPVGRSVALYRDEQGRVHAISIVCTHLGCIVKPTPSGFDCPCHGTVFAADGRVKKGPAPKGLPWLAVHKTDNGSYLVNEGKTVPRGRRTS